MNNFAMLDNDGHVKLHDAVVNTLRNNPSWLESDLTDNPDDLFEFIEKIGLTDATAINNISAFINVWSYTAS